MSKNIQEVNTSIVQGRQVTDYVDALKVFKQGDKVVVVNTDGFYGSSRPNNEDFDLEKGIMVALLKHFGVQHKDIKKLVAKTQMQEAVEKTNHKDEDEMLERVLKAVSEWKLEFLSYDKTSIRMEWQREYPLILKTSLK